MSARGLLVRLALIASAFLVIAATPIAAAPKIVVLELDDTIQPASLRYVERGLERAAEQHAELVLIELDTPGGLAVSLREMTSAVIGSTVAVAVYVTPAGGRAASAGFFLLLAADVAVMAPGTNTGAAHPVAIGARGQEQGEDSSAGASLDKATNDAAALARSLATARGRSAEWAEKAILESAAFTAGEALEHRLIDTIAIDRDALLRELDGKTISRFDGSTQTLHLRGAEIVSLERTFAERVLRVIADPQVAYLLLVLGAIGLMLELTNPGLIVPGVAGGLSLLLGLYGLSVVPVSVAGGLLIAAGLALLVAEVFVTSYGLLAVAGTTSFVVGSLMLVDSPIPELQIGPAVVVPVAVVLAALTAFLAVRAFKSRNVPPQAGAEAMIGERGDVVEEITRDGDGRVFVHGESWAATSTRPLPTGAAVRVEALDGLRLRVAPVPPGGVP